MKLGEVFTSNYLTSTDLHQQDVPVTITTVASKDFENDKGGKDMKLIIGFKELEKSLVCNKTNATTIGDIHGDETDEWPGKRITLYETEVEFGGKTTLGIRVRLRAPGGSPATATTTNGGGTSDALKAAKTRAWHEYIKLTGAGTNTEVATRLGKVTQEIYNKSPADLTTQQWYGLIETSFQKPAGAISDEHAFEDSQIPF